MLYSNKLDIAERVYFEPIKITSPEQFVPLYLIRESPVVYKHTCRPSFTSNVVHNIQASSHQRWFNDKESYKAEVRDNLITQLNHSYPKEYRFSLLINGHHYWTNVDITNLNKIFLAGQHDRWGITNGVFNLGLAVSGSGRQEYVTLNTGGFYDQMSFNYFRTKSLYPEILVLIKAKHVPELRVRFHLCLPITLPLGDMRVLISKSYTTMATTLINTKEWQTFVSKTNPIIEYTDKNVMLEYLIPPIKQTISKQQYLKNVVGIVDEHLVLEDD